MLDVSHLRTFYQGCDMTWASDVPCIGLGDRPGLLQSPNKAKAAGMQRQLPVGEMFQAAVHPLTGVVQLN